MWSRIMRASIASSIKETKSLANRKTGSLRNGLVISALIVALGPSSANAVEMGLLLTMPALLNEITLLVAIIAFFGGLKVYGLVKGGLLAKCWQMFLFGFGALTLAQTLRLMNTLGFVEIPEVVSSLLLVCMAVLWFLGMREARKALGA